MEFFMNIKQYLAQRGKDINDLRKVEINVEHIDRIIQSLIREQLNIDRIENLEEILKAIYQELYSKYQSG